MREGGEIRRQWQGYSPFYSINKAGDEVIMRCTYVPCGEFSGHRLTDSELRLWITEFGSVICNSEYVKIMATPEWEQEE